MNLNSPQFFYDFLAPSKIIFGSGRRREVGKLAAALGGNAIIIPGSRTLVENGTVPQLASELKTSGVRVATILPTIREEPTVKLVDSLKDEVAAHHNVDLIISVGGGSALDVGKALAALVTNTQGNSVQDFLEGVGQGLKISNQPLPFLAIPTTAGTGSEVTINSVISNYSPPFKKSLRAPAMMADTVLVDPELTASLSPQIATYTGLDAITQCIESFLSNRATSMSHMVAMQGLLLGWNAIELVVAPNEYAQNEVKLAREQMCQCALLSGLALANSGLGLAHGVAAALGAHAKLPHGLACAVMLPSALRFNRSAATKLLAQLADAIDATERNDHDESKRREKRSEKRSIIGQTDVEKADWFIDRVESLCYKLNIPEKLSELNLSSSMIKDLVSSSHGNSLNGNPRDVSDEQLEDILGRLF